MRIGVSVARSGARQVRRRRIPATGPGVSGLRHAIGLVALVASGTLAASPAFAAMSSRADGDWLPLCGGDGAHFLFVPLHPGDRPPAHRNDSAPLCAHLTCAREPRGDGKARGLA